MKYCRSSPAQKAACLVRCTHDAPAALARRLRNRAFAADCGFRIAVSREPAADDHVFLCAGVGRLAARYHCGHMDRRQRDDGERHSPDRSAGPAVSCPVRSACRYFFTIVGLLSLFVSIYSIGYVQGFPANRPVTSLIIFYCLFLAGMFMVILADDALFFLVAWEVMAGASYFLVLFEHERQENRKAAFLYLVVAHIGAIAILLAFGVLAGIATPGSFSGYTFDAMRGAEIPDLWATVAFFLAFFGFAAKAGVVPLHVWLPEAHPVAPSNVSALMSGVMLKTAIYGIVRVTFDLIHTFPWWWGAIVLTLGLISAVMGVLYALMQHDLKRLLAYHSVENIGIILIGIGLAMILPRLSFRCLPRSRLSPVSITR